MKKLFLMSVMDARIVGIESVIHRLTPTMVRTMPAIGTRGISGQRIMRARLKIPPTIIMMQPTMRRISLEKKPTIRETRRSINMWNLRSREESAPAEAAEI